MPEALPLLEEARVGLADDRPEEAEGVPQLLALRRLGDGLVERLVELREVPEEDSLAPLQAVAPHVVGEAGEGLDHLAADRLRLRVEPRGPGVLLAEGGERAEEEVGERLRVADLLELRHPLLVRHPFRLQLLDQLSLRPVGLLPEDDVGVLQDRLDDRDGVEGVRRRGPVEPLQRRDGEERESLVEREVELEVGGEDDPVRARRPFVHPRHPDDPGLVEGADQRRRLLQEARLPPLLLVALRDEIADRPEVAATSVVVPISLDQVEDHPVRQAEP